MAYGIAINTMFGFKNVTAQQIPKFVETVNISASAGRSGSFTAPSGVTDANAILYTEFSIVQLSISGSTISWNYVFPASFYPNTQDFTIQVAKTG